MIDQYLGLAVILFVIGAIGVMIRRNALVAFMSVELMLNAANLALVAFAWHHGSFDGQVASFFVMVVAAAEVVVGLDGVDAGVHGALDNVGGATLAGAFALLEKRDV